MDALPFLILFAIIYVLKVVGTVLLLIAFAGGALWIFILIALSLMRAATERHRHARHHHR